MKYRESGMPNEEMWNRFFNPGEVLERMEINDEIRILVDIGCGFGTFLLPAAGMVRSKVFGVDIDPDMINICRQKANRAHITNIELVHGDISSSDTIKALEKIKQEIDYITLFNILHCEDPIGLLRKTHDLLADKGKVGVIHWKFENTPRGPSMEIRPKPEMIIDWAVKNGFTLKKQVELQPYHFGLVFEK